MIRILVVDDRTEICHGLQMRLDAERDMLVVGEAGDAVRALHLVDDLCPDLVLMDVEIPARDGIETCSLLHRTHPNIPVVILSIHDDAATRQRAARAHAAGFVSKDQPVDCLLTAIRAAARSSPGDR